MSNDETSATRNLDGASHVRAGEDGDFRRSVAVIIGVDAYGGGIPTLQSAVGDASALAAILAKSHGYTDPILLVDEQATLAGLREVLDVTLPARVGPGDRVIFYFADHGTAIESEDRPKGF